MRMICIRMIWHDLACTRTHDKQARHAQRQKDARVAKAGEQAAGRGSHIDAYFERGAATSAAPEPSASTRSSTSGVCVLIAG